MYNFGEIGQVFIAPESALPKTRREFCFLIWAQAVRIINQLILAIIFLAMESDVL